MQRLSSRLQEERRSLLPDTYSLEHCAQQYLELFANLQRKSLWIIEVGRIIMGTAINLLLIISFRPVSSDRNHIRASIPVHWHILGSQAPFQALLGSLILRKRYTLSCWAEYTASDCRSDGSNRSYLQLEHNQWFWCTIHALNWSWSRRRVLPCEVTRFFQIRDFLAKLIGLQLIVFWGLVLLELFVFIARVALTGSFNETYIDDLAFFGRRSNLKLYGGRPILLLLAGFEGYNKNRDKNLPVDMLFKLYKRIPQFCQAFKQEMLVEKVEWIDVFHDSKG